MAAGNDFFTYLSPFDLMQRVFNIYGSHFLLFTQLALIATIPKMILAVMVGKPLAEEEDSEMMYEEVTQYSSPQRAIVLQLEIFVSSLITVFIQAAMIHVVSEIYMQREPAFKRSLAVAMNRFCALFCFGLLYLLIFSIFFAVVGVPVFLLYTNQNYVLAVLIGVTAFAIALYVIITLMIALPILVVEHQSPTGAIRRSFDLVPGYRCYIFCSVLLLNVIVWLASLLVEGVVRAIFGASIVAILLSSLLSLISLPVLSIMLPGLYFSIRVQKEGMNMESLMKEFEGDMDGTARYEHKIVGGETV
ncbi:hypothetical protein FisN_22Lh169 [Fistulifera solaris]|uniref:Uncharacterized protein n=1 Tax=Fistulifera solaris TaxID=1519565 RepID=A0A1Z5JBU4_FISSO|nr:hypothetical protein FisN_22Lh169 [Fistulifera solaris]|eukprot:GAX11484.1 hypothetical protein FisN_22Lh169 [Fistulifera solaris]